MVHHAPVMTTTWPPVENVNLPDASGAKVKRAIASLKRRRESIQITPGGYIRRRRQTEQYWVKFRTPEDVHRANCCEISAIKHCKCNYSTCKDIECEHEESKILVLSDSNVPGHCCPIYTCSTQRPTCFSSNLKRHFLVNETWNDDDCTHCECGDKGDIRCQTSVCKAISCEKKIRKPGQCCPECDFSNSKYCVGDEDCDIHCRNGFDTDPTNGCTICRCAKLTTTTTTTASSSSSAPVTSTAAATTSSTESSIDAHIDDIIRNTNDNSTGAAPSTDTNSWLLHSPIILSICIIIGAFIIVVSLSFRYMAHNKGKHRLNRKQNNNLTPLI